jgi:hypothetical protein
LAPICASSGICAKIPVTVNATITKSLIRVTLGALIYYEFEEGPNGLRPAHLEAHRGAMNPIQDSAGIQGPTGPTGAYARVPIPKVPTHPGMGPTGPQSANYQSYNISRGPGGQLG